jgi:Zn-dependent protease
MFEGKGLTLFRIAGIPVEIRLGFLVIAFVVAMPYFGSFDPQDWAIAAIILAILVVSVFLHELGHVGAGAWLGISTRRIAFDWFGGVAMMESLPQSVRGRVFVLLAGPAVTALLMAATYLAEPLLGNWSTGAAAPSFRDYLIFTNQMIWQINLGLLIFNMLPAFPLDGGQTLAALLERPAGRRIAWGIVSAIGSALALVAVYLVYAYQSYGLAMGAFVLALSNFSILRSVIKG